MKPSSFFERSTMEETIAAIATPRGVGGIGIVRISGPAAIEVGDRVIRMKGKSLAEMDGYTCAYGRIFDGQGELDEAVATVFRAPRSYTGEDVVELSVHGGTYLVERVLQVCCDNGARPALAGEFTKRAFLNGKLDLTRAEAVVDLIAAQGRQSARAALAARDGALFQKAGEVAAALVSGAAGLAAWIDYPEEDIEETERRSLDGKLELAAAELDKLLDTYEAGRVFREGIETVIVGRPNVGKSTLMNLLADCERSIVTEIAGTTRDVVSDTVRLGEIVLHLSDTAGIRETGDLVERVGVERAEDALRKAQLILAVFDGSMGLDENDRRVIDRCRGGDAVALINKNDLPQCLETREIEEAFEHVVYLSAKEKEGTKALEETVERLFELERFDPSAAAVANERQRESVRRARDSVRQAMEALRDGVSLDAVGVCIEEGADALLELTGEKAGQAVVNEIFARFCVGK